MKMIVLGSDHAGYELKQHVKKYFDKKGIEYVDLGFHELKQDDDYPVIAKEICRYIQEEKAEKGLLFCGTGVGMSICANKAKGIRAVVASDVFSVRYCRLHNDANVLCLGARVMARGLATDLIDVFLNTEFEGGRHAVRVNMFEENNE